MIRYECDKCGAAMSANDSRRYIVRIEVYAAAGPVDLTPDERRPAGDNLDDVLRQLADADPDDIEDQTYRLFRFDLCDDCRRLMIAQPLG